MIDIETDEVKVQKTILTIQKKLGLRYMRLYLMLCAIILIIEQQ